MSSSKSSSSQYARNLHSYLNGATSVESMATGHHTNTTASSHRQRERTRSRNSDGGGQHNPPSIPHPPLSTSSWSLASSDSLERASPSLSSSTSLNSVNLTTTSGPVVAPDSAATTASAALQLRPDYDLLTRPAWIDAEVGLDAIESGAALGSRSSLWLRALIQARFYELGTFIQAKAGTVLFVGLLILVTFCIGLKSARLEANLEKLWVEDGGRLEKEMQYVRSALGEGSGVTNEILQQTAKEGSVLHQNAMLLHLEALRWALEASVDMFEANWKLKDICYRPATPQFESHSIDSFLERLIPCTIITPLDCFWEGSYLLGPDIPVQIPFMAMPVEWTTLNPDQLISTMMANLKAYRKSELGSPSGSRSVTWEIEAFYKFMKQSGITTGYQTKPCLNPANPNCPPTAPNYNSTIAPDIGAELTGGCFGFATKYMHWPENLIIGTPTRNRTGHIVSAKAIQSFVQLLGEQELYYRYQSDYKVHNTDWSVDKAKMVLEAWQRKFTEQLGQFLEEADGDLAGIRTQNLELFTSTAVNDILRSASQVNFLHLAIEFAAMAIYVGITLYRRAVDKSQVFVGIAGVLLLELAIASGLGLCALLGLDFNVITNLVLPVLSLGMGCDGVFLMARVYASAYMLSMIPLELRTAECLKQVSLNLCLVYLISLGSFLAASLFNLPSLRTACFGLTIIHSFIAATTILLFPALTSLVLRFRYLYLTSTPFGSDADQGRRPSSVLVNMAFLICCCNLPRKRSGRGNSSAANSSQQLPVVNYPSYIQPYNYYYLNSITQRPDVTSSASSSESKKSAPAAAMAKSTSLDSGIDQMELGGGICKCGAVASTFTSLEDNSVSGADGGSERLMHKCTKCGGDLRPACEGQDDVEGGKLLLEQEGEQELEAAITNSLKKPSRPHRPPFKCSLQYLMTQYYIPLLLKKPIKALVLITFLIALVLAFLGAGKIEDGLDLTDIVPRNTTEHRFLAAQRQHFSFFYMYAVTMGNFDYPNSQRLLHEYHHAFTRVPAIIKNDDGALPPFWLTMFRDWLLGLQAAFDRDWSAGLIHAEGWNKANASEDGILAFKLLVQTGRVDNPIDKSLLTTNRLVDEAGIINPKAFYNYLTAWVHTDVMAYSASEANFHPDPQNRKFAHDSHDTELKIPKAAPLTYAQIPFYLNNIRTTAQITATIEEVRGICRKFEDRSLPNFPMGTPFTFWEQYIWMRYYVAAGVVVVLAVSYLAFTLFLLNPWSAFLVVFVQGATMLEVVGVMGWLGIKLSAVPGVILIISVAVGGSFMTHILISFITAIGDRNRRMAMSLEHMFTPVKNSIVSTAIAVAMLGFCQFDFIFEYFFLVLLAVLLLGAANALTLLPVLLTLFGPSPEIIPLEYDDRIGTPSPPSSPTIASRSTTAAAGGQGYASYSYPVPSGSSAHSNSNSASTNSKPKRNILLGRFHKRRGAPVRVLSEISLSTISEEPNSYVSSTMPTPTPSRNSGAAPNSGSAKMCPAAAQAHAAVPGTGPSGPHEIVVQPEFVVETTITNNGVVNGGGRSSSSNGATSVTPTSENGSTSGSSSSSSSSSDGTSTTSSPSPTSDRDSPSGRSESAQSSASRCSSAASFTTTTTTSMNAPSGAASSTNNPTELPSSSSTTVTTKVMATAKLTIPMVHPQHPALHPQMYGFQPIATSHPAMYVQLQPHQHQPPHPHHFPPTCLGCMTPGGVAANQPRSGSSSSAGLAAATAAANAAAAAQQAANFRAWASQGILSGHHAYGMMPPPAQNGRQNWR